MGVKNSMTGRSRKGTSRRIGRQRGGSSMGGSDGYQPDWLRRGKAIPIGHKDYGKIKSGGGSGARIRRQRFQDGGHTHTIAGHQGAEI